MGSETSSERYRDRQDTQSGDEDDADEDRERDEKEDDVDDESEKAQIKSERLSPCENGVNSNADHSVRSLPGLHLTFNLEAGTLLPLALRFVLYFSLFITNLLKKLEIKFSNWGKSFSKFSKIF